MIAGRSLPDALISEDGRLVAIRGEDGAIAVNRKRPSAFTTEDWQRALAGATVVKPTKPASAELVQPAADNGAGFRCLEQACIARTSAGAIIVNAGSVAAAQPYCTTAQLIVIDDATAANPCAADGPTVVTKRDLARRGAAAVSFVSGGGKPSAQISYAIDEPYRPWHTQRGFSREARGLAPRQAKPVEKQPQPNDARTSTARQSEAHTAKARPDADPSTGGDQ
jgi:competence protein ComEC